jgi:hypothetical protein
VREPVRRLMNARRERSEASHARSCGHPGILVKFTICVSGPGKSFLQYAVGRTSGSKEAI